MTQVRKVNSKKTYRDVLIDNNFTYNKSTDSHRKSLGFGQFITVELICSTLFRVKKADKIHFDNFVKSLKHFEEIINKVLLA